MDAGECVREKEEKKKKRRAALIKTGAQTRSRVPPVTEPQAAQAAGSTCTLARCARLLLHLHRELCSHTGERTSLRRAPNLAPLLLKSRSSSVTRDGGRLKETLVRSETDVHPRGQHVAFHNENTRVGVQGGGFC